MTLLKVEGQEVSHIQNGRVINTSIEKDPLTVVEAFQKNYKVPDIPGLPRFNGGLVGYFAYDTVRYVEPKLQATVPKDVLGCPDQLVPLRT